MRGLILFSVSVAKTEANAYNSAPVQQADVAQLVVQRTCNA